MPPEHPPDPEDVTPAPGHIERVPVDVKPQAVRSAQPVEPSSEKTPLSELSGEKWAGFWLTCVVLLMITLFLLAALVYLWTTQLPACKILTSLGDPLSKALTEGKPLPETLSTLLQQCETQQKAFYAFWLDMVQRILLNALLPVLTALLGYLFGTQQVRAAQE